ncbi:Inosine/uridine-preferring nucleoside hydrolase domain-containing protein [Ilyonectria sp. MPI-CAGE-AT-0026]|nr:Inosine/uridine-preferring nucleoside hydrolase domain-containing protein [Ilyonectria sp. MPI-CAGE-AT-0026]
MSPQNRVIIDTDPGIDDALALLLALSSSSEDIEVALVSVTYGNVPLQSCLRNVIALFHVLEKEMEWRRSKNLPEGFGCLRASKTLIAAGAEHSLLEEELAADFFHGVDGLHGVHEACPFLSPSYTWSDFLEQGGNVSNRFFEAAKDPAHKEILKILRESPPDTVSIAVLGPMTNIALAAAEDPETFLRVKEVTVMAGAVHLPGNITPFAEFNTFADPIATARVFALTSPSPQSTMPTFSPASLLGYPSKLSQRLKVRLFPLDITTRHRLDKSYFLERINTPLLAGSPLAQWTNHFVTRAFDKLESLEGGGENYQPRLSLHDPMVIWYLLTREDPDWLSVTEDIRIETAGEWTRGMHAIDKRIDEQPEKPQIALKALELDPDSADTVPGDGMGWGSSTRGNRIMRTTGSPGESIFEEILMRKIFS